MRGRSRGGNHQGAGIRGGTGFSVIELILGLGIIAAMGGSVYMVYANAVRIDAQSRRSGDLSFESYMIFKSIEEDLGKFVNYRFKRPGETQERLAFKGGENKLEFVRETPQGLEWVRYALADESAGVVRKTVMGRRYTKNTDQTLDVKSTDVRRKQMVRKNILIKGLPPQDGTDTDEQTVSRNIYTDGLRFFYADKAENSSIAWNHHWQGLDAPAVIRVELKLSQGASGQVAEFTRDILIPAGI